MTLGHRYWLPLVLILVVLSRFPLLGGSYGNDSDAWRVAAVAHHLKETGEYRTSRFPGYPLHELVAAPFVLLGGAALSNAATLGAMLFAILVWHRFASRSTANPDILVIAFAFTPLLWTNSATTMDYVWSLLFILLSFNAVQQKNVARAGIYFGLAAGFRLTNLVALLPILMMAWSSGISRKQLACLIGCASSVLFVAFIPIFTQYGPVIWYNETLKLTTEVPLSLIERLLLFTYRSIYSIGPLAAVVAATIIFLGKTRLREHVRSRSAIPMVSLVALLSFGGLFFVFPFEREYLIPAVPFLLLLIDSLGSRMHLVIITVCLVSFAFVNPDVIRHHGARGTPQFNLREGMLLDYVNKKNMILARREELGTLVIPGKAMVMTGTGPDLWVENELLQPDQSSFKRTFPDMSSHQKLNPGTHFIDGLSKEEVSFAQGEGYIIYCYRPAQEYLERTMGYTMERMNIGILPSKRPESF